MPSFTMARGLLGHFPQGTDPPATNQCVTTPPVQSPKYFSYVRYWRPGPGEVAQGPEGGRGENIQRSIEERGSNRTDARRGGYGGRTINARRITTAETARGGKGHDRDQVSSKGDGGEHRARGDGQEGRTPPVQSPKYFSYVRYWRPGPGEVAQGPEGGYQVQETYVDRKSVV